MKIDIDSLNISHHFGGGIYAKETLIPTGYILVQHKHSFDHLSILSSGQAVVSEGDSRGIINGPHVLTIKAGVHHSIKALTDCVWFCIHATSETDIDKIDKVIIVDGDEEEIRRMLSEDQAA